MKSLISYPVRILVIFLLLFADEQLFAACASCDDDIPAQVSFSATHLDVSSTVEGTVTAYFTGKGEAEGASIEATRKANTSGGYNIFGEIVRDLKLSLPKKGTPSQLKLTASWSFSNAAPYHQSQKFKVIIPQCYKRFKIKAAGSELEFGIGDGLDKMVTVPGTSLTAVVLSPYEIDGESKTVINISGGIPNAVSGSYDLTLSLLSDSPIDESGSGGDAGFSGDSGGYGSKTSAGSTSAGNGGQGAGNTAWSTEDIANATDLETVGFTASSSVLGIEKIETSSISQKQLYVEDMNLVNVSSSGGVLTIGYYSNGQVGSVDSNGFYTFSGTPYKEIVVTQTSSTTATYVSKENGVTVGSWTLGGGLGTQIVDNNSNRKEVNAGGVDVNGDRTETREVWYTLTNQLVTKTLRVYKTFSVDEDSDSGTPDVTWEKLIRDVNDPDGAALTTTYTYETNPSSPNYKMLVSTKYPDGNWSYKSSPLVTWQPFKDGVNGTTPPTNAPANNATGYVRRFSGANDYSETFINGDLVGKTEASSTLTGQTFGGVSGLSKVTRNRIFGTGSSDKLASTSYYYSYSEPVEYLRGKLFARVEVDGTCTKYEYAQGTYSAGTFTAGTGTDSKTVAMRGYVSSGAPAFVSNKSTASETVENERGQSLQERELLWNGTDFSTVLTTTRNTYDGKGNIAETKRLTSADPNWITVFAATYDVQGNMTSSNDEFGVISSSITEGRTTTYTSTDGHITRTNVVVVDVAGRIVSETNDGLTTTYAYSSGSNGGKKVTKTLPSGATSITEYYLDGQVKSISGTGEIARTFDYGAAVGERSSSVTTSGRTVATVSDMMGRTKQVTRPKFGGGTSTTVSAYNNLGQLVSETIDSAAIVAPRGYVYDTLGAMIQYGFDIDGSGLSTSGSSPDRVSENEQYYAQSGGNWYSVSKSGKYLPTGLQVLQETWNRVDGKETIVKSGDRTVTSTTAIDPSDSSKVVISMLDSDIGSPSNQVYKRGVTLLESREPWQTGSGEKTVYTYTSGMLSKITDALGRETALTYVPQGINGAGSEWVRTMPGGATIEKTYNSLGLVDTESGTGTYWRKFGYNDAGEMTTLQTQGAAGLATTTWRREINTGLVDRKIDALGKYVEYTYNAVGWPVTRTWARGVITTYGHNVVGDVNSIDYSDGTAGASDMEYDKGGRLIEVVDASGMREISYSNFDNRADETYSGSGVLSGYEITRTFNQQRRASLAATGPSSFAYPTVSYTYNSGTRVQTITQGSLTTTYTPQPGMLQPASVDSVWSGGITLERAYGYDVLGRTTAVVDAVGSNIVSASGTSVTPIAYDTAGRRTRIVDEDGSIWNYEYNSRDEVVSAKKRFADNGFVPGHQFAYNYDGIGNRLTAAKGGNEAGTGLSPVDYTPNLLNQYGTYTTPKQAWITGEASPGASVTIDDKVAWRHSEFFGRELSIANDSGPASKDVTVKANMPPSGGFLISASYSGKLLAAPVTVTPIYDLDGNLTDDGLWIYAWDGEGRLKSIETVSTLPTVDQRRQEYSYDFEGRLVKIAKFINSGSVWTEEISKSTVLLYDGWNIISEKVGGDVRTYLWGIDHSGNFDGAGGVGGFLAMNDSVSMATYVAGADVNGNVTALVASVDGLICGKYGYGPFGESLQVAGSVATINSIRWSSKFFDSNANLVYYGYRFYSAINGRWLNRDVIDEAGGLNLYGMLQNDAVNSVDYLGQREVRFKIAAGPDLVGSTFPSSDVQPHIKKLLGYVPKLISYPANQSQVKLATLKMWLKSALEAKKKETGNDCCNTFDLDFKFTPTANDVRAHLSGEADKYLIFAHGDASYRGETGIILNVGQVLIGQRMSAVAVPVPLSEVLGSWESPDGSLYVGSCFDQGLAKTVNKTAILRLGANVNGLNAIASFSTVFMNLVKAYCCDDSQPQ